MYRLSYSRSLLKQYNIYLITYHVRYRLSCPRLLLKQYNRQIFLIYVVKFMDSIETTYQINISHISYVHISYRHKNPQSLCVSDIKSAGCRLTLKQHIFHCRQYLKHFQDIISQLSIPNKYDNICLLQAKIHGDRELFVQVQPFTVIQLRG